MSRKRQIPREVVRIISPKELYHGAPDDRVPTMIGGGHLEVREHLDGSWSVHYPEEGFIPSTPGQARPFTECTGRFSYSKALEYAHLLAEGREVKAIGSKRGK